MRKLPGNKGDEKPYLDLLAFMETNDLKDPENYAYVQTQMDIANFIDYQIINIFLANIDWPQNNVKFWRVNTDKYDPGLQVKMGAGDGWFLI